MKQVTAVLIGAGLRGSEAYAAYALSFPAEFKIVAVAEPDPARREKAARTHGLEEKRCYDDYRRLLEEERLADCALVCTQDTMHYEPVTLALRKGYHVLCEKPMSPDPAQIVTMGKMAKRYDRVLSVCHVLRYSAFYKKIKEMLTEGRIGRLINIQQTENVGYWHHAHSFVRGNWRNAELSSPMILQKCCHDMDILLWLSGGQCKKISSFGGLTYFKEENAPADAPAHCMDGCEHREECPFYAPRFYLEHPKALEDQLIRAVSTDISREAVLERLKDGPYGRCVFHCDNTVVDHQAVNLEFDNEVTAAFTMSAFTADCRREIKLMGTRGQLTGDMEEGTLTLFDFATGNKENTLLYTPPGGHSGSDTLMMRDFVRLVAEDGKGTVKTGSEVSVDSHLMALAAEASRLEDRVVDFQKYKEEVMREVEKN